MQRQKGRQTNGINKTTKWDEVAKTDSLMATIWKMLKRLGTFLIKTI